MNDLDPALPLAYPGLRRLLELRRRGWEFLAFGPVAGVAGRGGIAHLTVGTYRWPRGWTDHLHVLQVDSWAGRTTRPEGGELVWLREGELGYVLDELLELPPPDDPRAPQLVLPGRPPPLWTP
jgi:hypothetical protein